MTIGAVGIITCDRTARLIECVTTYAANCRQYDRSPDFLVLDDSRDPDAADRTRAALTRLSRQLGVSIRYAGARERRRFADQLAAEAGVPADIVRFGLLGDGRLEPSTGANRNGLLLDTAGELVFSADDDTVCRLASAPDRDDTAALAQVYDPTELWFHPDRASALESLATGDADLLGLHEALLGRPVADVTAVDDDRARITITMQGLAGDSGMASPRYYFSLADASRDRLVRSEEAYRSALASREIVRTARRPAICAESFVMTTFYGFDNRSPLPPFFPVLRNSDGAFGVMLPRCVDGSHVAFLPWTLAHLPDEPRRFTADAAFADADGVRMADVVIDGVLTHAPPAEPRPDDVRIAQLGTHLCRLGALPPAEFEAHVRHVQDHRAAAFMTLLSHRLQIYRGLPSFWADDVHRLIDRMARARVSEGFVVPRDLAGRYDVETSRRLGQELIARFGTLLDAWPAITRAAARLRARGNRLTRPVVDRG